MSFSRQGVCLGGVGVSSPLPFLGQGWSLDEAVAPPPEGMSLDTSPAGIATPVLWPSFPMGAGPCCRMTG